MADPFSTVSGHLSGRLARARLDVERAVAAGVDAAVETALRNWPALSGDDDAVLDLIYSEYLLRVRAGRAPTVDELAGRFPGRRADLAQMLDVHHALAEPPAVPGRPLPRVGERVAGVYELRAELGRGGMGVVFRATDVRLDRPVAIKFLHTAQADEAETVDRFRREARAASAINDPHICTVYEFDTHDGRPFIAMELVDGKTLQTHAAGGVGVREAVSIISQVARVLAETHARGVVHRDIKPGNLMVRPDGLVKVLDFGLARLSWAQLPGTTAAVTEPGKLIGTIAYMSPEQARGTTISEATDLFSLGVVFYELLTGRHPFEAESQLAMLSSILAGTPVPPSAAGREIPQALSDFVLELLAVDPGRRPTAVETVRRLSTWLAQTPDESSAAGYVPLETPGMIGRTSELRLLRAAHARAKAGHGGVVGVAGEPGIGKTMLVDTFLNDVAAREKAAVRIATGRCSERLAGTEAYLPVLEALDHLTRGADGDASRRLLRSVAPTWYTRLTPFADEDSGSRLRTEAQASSQERMKREFVAFIENASADRLIVLNFDDVHWADDSTVDLIAYLASKAGQLKLLLVLTYRTSELALSNHPFAALKQDLLGRNQCTEIELPLLEPNDIEHYLRTAFAAGAFDQDFVAFLHARTGGHPLFMVDLVKYLRDLNVIGEENGVWRVTRPDAPATMDLPQSVRNMVQRKIDRLSEDDRKLLAAASVQGHEFDAAVVSAAVRLDPADVEERLAWLERTHAVIRRTGEKEFADGTLTMRFVFVHAFYQNAFHQSLLPARKAALSAAVAEKLIELFGSDTASIAGQLAVLFEAARNFAAAAEWFATSAEQSAKVFARGERLVQARRGIELLKRLPASERRDEIELRLRISLAMALQTVEGFASATTADELRRAYTLATALGQAMPRFQALTGLYFFWASRGRFAGECEQIATDMGLIAEAAGDPVMRMQAYQSAALNQMQRGELRAAGQSYAAAVALFRPDEHRGLTFLLGQNPGVLALGFGAVNLCLLGDTGAAVTKVREAVRVAETIVDPQSMCFAVFHLDWVMLLCGDPNLPIPPARMFELSGRSPFWGSIAEAFDAWALLQRGEPVRAAEEMSRAIADFKAAAGIVLLPQFLSVLAEACCGANRISEGLAAVQEGLRVAESTGNRMHDAELYRTQACLEHAAGLSRETVHASLRAGRDVAERQDAQLFLRNIFKDEASFGFTAAEETA